MIETARFEARRRARRAVVVGVVMAGLVALVVAMFPSIQEAEGFESYVEELPDALTAALGGDVAVNTIEGFLIIEIYRMTWMLIVGAYFAYASASFVAGEVDRGSIELTLMNPVRRRRIVVEKFLSAVPDTVVVSLLTFVTVVVSVTWIEESIDIANLAVLHAVGTVYLLACVGFGLLVSTLVTDEQRAQVIGFGGIAGMYILEAVTRDTDYEWISLPMIPRYFDPNSVLIDGEINMTDTLVLVLITVAFVWLAAVVFERADVA
ncbi:MAG: ABC transporter permease subunit [Halobacteriales archaeon]|nr:ABC transporter permease subunit [Halobacteriales archaeon]